MPDRHGILRPRACSIVYRVVEVIGMTDTAGFAGSGRTREFKTHKAAQRYRDELAGEGRWPAMIQFGCVQWLTEEEANEWIEQHQGDYWE